MRITILGCGASGGVPLVGCVCSVCTGNNPKNVRTRSSVLVEHEGSTLLVDASPDLRQQALRHGFSTLDGVLFTHAHADHMHGIDDLKAFNFHKGGPIDCYGDAATLHDVRERFSYALANPQATHYGYRPSLNLHEIDYYQSLKVGKIEAQTFLQLHGKMPTMGLRFGNIAYSTDVNNLPEQSLQVLESLDVWIVDCLQIAPAPTHAHLAMTLEWIAQLKPKKAILTHMSHALDYETLIADLPSNVEPAFDGLVIEA